MNEKKSKFYDEWIDRDNKSTRWKDKLDLEV